MARAGAEPGQGVIDAYAARDAEALAGLRADDEQIDVMYNTLFRELLTYMMEDPRNITACTHLLFWPRTSSASATTSPTSPRTSIT